MSAEAALDKTGVTVRAAGPDDAVSGVQPRWVVLPESAEEISAVLGACAEHDLAVVPVGGGSKLHWGPRPERCDVLLDTCCMNEVIEHATGDLIVRVQAGLTMEALAETLAAGGQELVLDPPVEGATVGGTLATATAGPRAFRYGTARDLLIGITVVLADGTIAKSGGKVVKNVAGYDLGKLFTGSYGTLGVIADATFRLHPLPADRRWVSVSRPDPGLLRLLAASQAEPTAIEIDQPGLGAPLTVSVLVEGVAAQSRAAALAVLLDAQVSAEAPSWWGALPGDEVLVEVRAADDSALTQIPLAAHKAGVEVAFRGSPGRVLVALPDGTPQEQTAAFVRELRHLTQGKGVTVLAAPYDVEWWSEISALALMRRVKERFDPGRRMSPGRFVGGI